MVVQSTNFHCRLRLGVSVDHNVNVVDGTDGVDVNYEHGENVLVHVVLYIHELYQNHRSTMNRYLALDLSNDEGL